MPNFISVHITAPSRDLAEKIAHALVQEKLAACVNMIPGMWSVYRWQGGIHESDEVLLIAKTRAELFEPLKKLVKTLHSEECPCILASIITAGHQPYLDWLAQETTP